MGPLHLDAPVGFVKKVLDVWTTACMDRNAFAAGDVTNDLFAADWITTTCAIDEKIVLPFDLERVGTLAEKDTLDGLRHMREGIADGARLC
jgi:hypothetical protein